MRQDLTAAFIAAMEKPGRVPIQVIVFRFAAGDVFLSDRVLTIGAQEYRPLVESWGSINTAGFNTSDFIQETQQTTVSIWNGPAPVYRFSDNFVLEDPTNVQVDLYQTFDGLAESDMAHIGAFVIQEPIKITEASRLLRLDLVSLNMRYVAQVGPVLSAADYPQALEADINKGVDLIVGDAGPVQTLAAKTPLSATMTGSILSGATIVNTHEDLDALGFPAAGYIVIDDEIMGYSSRDSDTFNVNTRGAYGTTATGHSDGAIVLEYITDHTYIIGQGPLASVSDVRVGGLPADPADYTLDLVSDPATITFTAQPQYIEYPKGARLAESLFDGSTASNTALYPHYAYDLENRSSGAEVSSATPTLALIQNTEEPDLGAVVRAFLVVEHWATALMPNDYMDVWVDGIGDVGNLSRPNPDDVAAFQADVDIDHGHDHVAGGNHDHGFTNPNLSTSNPSHGHTVDGSTSDTYYSGVPREATWSGNSPIYYLPDPVDANTNTLFFTIDWYTYDPPSSLDVRYRKDGSWSGFDISSSATTTPRYISLGSGTVDAVYFRHTPDGSNTEFINMTLGVERTYDIVVDNQATNVQASHTSTGNVANENVDTTGAAIKDADDVNDLSTANRPLTNISVDSASRSLVEKFDLTKHLETIDWAWFQGREIRLTYTGNANGAKVIVTYVHFEIEYRERQTALSNNVTCSPVGSIGNRPDQVVQYLLHDVAGVPLDVLGSVSDGSPEPPLADTQFKRAGQKYVDLGYTIDGVIPAGLSVRQALQKVLKQSRGRLTWGGGMAQLAVREKTEDWTPVRDLDGSAVQANSLRAEKGPVSEIWNDIDLFYKVDRTSDSFDAGRYNGTASLTDPDSIAKHGQQKNNLNWLFDLVRADAMAADLVDYYLWRHGIPPTYYRWNSYLQQFDLEKGDVVRLSSDFGRLIRAPLRIVDIRRAFGSGKTGSINLVQIVAEAIRQKTHFIALDSAVVVVDDINIDIKEFVLLSDSVFIESLVQLVVTHTVADSITVSDDFTITCTWSSAFSDPVTAADQIELAPVVGLSDSVTVADVALVSDLRGFGACGFGGPEEDCPLPFGSPYERF